MNKAFLSISCRVITDAAENVDHTKNVFALFLPIDFQKEKLRIQQDPFIDSFDQKRYIISLQLTKQAHVKLFAENLFEKLSTQSKEVILSQLDSRIDDDCYLYIRLDKNPLVFDQKTELTQGGQCFHITFAVASYPKRKAVAKQVVENYIKSTLE